MMTHESQESFVYFLYNLGIQKTKKDLRITVQLLTREEIWEHYVAGNPYRLIAAELSHIHNVYNVDSLMAECSYKWMRSTFPKNAKGVTGLTPGKIINANTLDKATIQKFIKEHPNFISQNKRDTEAWRVFIKREQIHMPANDTSKQIEPVILPDSSLIDKSLTHKIFGEGTVKNITDQYILVAFKSGENKLLSYSHCIKKNLIQFE